jgi:P27 family predicted phage terminase small subunit
MGLRGPAPTPTPLLKLAGSRKVENRTAEPQSAVELPDPPDWLSREAKAEWRRVGPQLVQRRTISRADRAMLAAYCQAWGEFAKSAKDVDALDEGGEKHTGHMIDHPRVVLGRAVERLIKLADRFGFSPAAKARVRGEVEENKDEGGKGRFFGAAG